MLSDIPSIRLDRQHGYRLVNSKFPPIDLFDDVADPHEFDALFLLQSFTNPRLQNQTGEVKLLAPEEIPFGIVGCTYACAPFVHVNPQGSRFSDGSFGLLYLADKVETAISEVRYHQQKLWQNIDGLEPDSIVMRSMKFTFNAELLDLCAHPVRDIYHPEYYSASQAIGRHIRHAGKQGLQYHSVRQPGNLCWALCTPKVVVSAIQSAHFEFIYDSNHVTNVRPLKAEAAI